MVCTAGKKGWKVPKGNILNRKTGSLTFQSHWKTQLIFKSPKNPLTLDNKFLISDYNLRVNLGQKKWLEVLCSLKFFGDFLTCPQFFLHFKIVGGFVAFDFV
jgi:hypothetical protein